MNNETTKVDETISKTNNSLMKKTKVQLIEIILRKDEVERNLRTDIKNVQIEFNLLKGKYTLIERRYTALKDDYHNECDEFASIKQELSDKVQRYKLMFYLFLIAFIGFIVSIVL